MTEEPRTAPYMGTLDIYRQWMRLRLDGLDDAGAWRRLIAAMPRADRRRQLARTTVAGANGQESLTLSVPVMGGASVLKRGRPEEWLLSMHGRWEAVHAGALATAYAGTAFYPHVMPEIKKLLDATYEGMPFGRLTEGIHRVVSETLAIEALLPELRNMASGGGRLREIADEKIRGCHTDFTILDVIFRKGPEGIFTLL